MSINIPVLPFSYDSLEPFLSKEAVEIHFEKHHKGYASKLNKLIHGTKFDTMLLPDIIRYSEGEVFNNAAQVWNHSFYWKCLTPEVEAIPYNKLISQIKNSFESFENFKDEFNSASQNLFGSGWIFLIQLSDGNLKITEETNAGCPIAKNQRPLLICDIWEHAYYIDYRTDRKQYLENFWNKVNWKFIETQLV